MPIANSVSRLGAAENIIYASKMNIALETATWLERSASKNQVCKNLRAFDVCKLESRNKQLSNYFLT